MGAQPVRETTAPIDTVLNVDPITERLRLLAQDSPNLEDAVQIYELILPLIRDADLKVGPVSITADDVRAKMEKGVHILNDIDLDLDGRSISELMVRLAGAVESASEKRAVVPRMTAARQIRTAIEENILDINGLLVHAASGARGPVTAAAKKLHLDSDLIWVLLMNAIRPALQAWRRQLAPMAAEIQWDKGSCFICGAAATLGELRGDVQARHLRCGQCGADWRVRRLQCIYCGNEDHNLLGYIQAEAGNEKARVEVCDKCHGYIKVIATFAPTPPDMLPIEDLATLHLDYIAKKRGYIKHPTPV